MDDEAFVGEPAESTGADDDTVVSSRRARDPDATVPTDVTEVSEATRRIRRRRVASGDADATVALRGGDESTRRLARQPLGGERAPVLAGRPVMAAPAKRRRGDLHPAPVPPGYGERAVRPGGVGAVSTYRARAIPAPPPAPARPATAAVRRITDGGRSVARQSRRFAIIALGGFALACLVSAGGLVLIGQAAFGR